MSVTLETFQLPIGWSKEQPSNILPISVTLETFQSPIGLLKGFLPLEKNIACILVTFSTFQSFKSWLNSEEKPNI